MQIGNITLKNNIFLAPMAGISDLAYRNISSNYGAGLVYTEMVSAKALYFNDKKTHTLLSIDNPQEVPTAVQIFGSEPDIMAQIAEKAISTGATILDINMGCPTPKIVNNGEGSALMKNLSLASDIIKEVSNASKIPVTVKFRKGWDKNSINAIEFAQMAEKSGASAIAIHGRTRSEMYSGKADWEIIKEIKKAVDIPVIGNGDVFSADDVVNMLEYTRCDAVMIARGAQGNPFVFAQALQLLNGKTPEVITPAMRIKEAIEHTKLLVETKGEHVGINESRKHVAWYIKGLRGGSKVRLNVNKTTTLEAMVELLTMCNEQLAIEESSGG